MGEYTAIAHHEPKLPIPISLVAGRYLLFDIEAAIFLRRKHNICGYNIGTLAQIPSQNSFLGLPVILMPEEAQTLVDEGVGYILDDARAHNELIYKRDKLRSAVYRADIQHHANTVRQARVNEKNDSKVRAIGRQQTSERNPEGSLADGSGELPSLTDDGLFGANQTTTSTASSFTSVSASPHFVTPTSSELLLTDTNIHKISNPTLTIPNLPASYPLFRHLHSKGYFMTPGLRFGCQYTTYPGDPLRFHSHFLTADFGWSQNINLMDIVGGGRLGTGVKKGFLMGACDSSCTDEKSAVRTFSVEWAVM